MVALLVLVVLVFSGLEFWFGGWGWGLAFSLNIGQRCINGDTAEAEQYMHQPEDDDGGAVGEAEEVAGGGGERDGGDGQHLFNYFLFLNKRERMKGGLGWVGVGGRVDR